MSKDTAKLTEESLDDDERALLAKTGDEPGYFGQAMNTFRGPLAWVVWLIYLLNIASFAGFLYATWRFLGTTEPLAALHWGVAAIVLINFTLFFKGSMGAHGETNRILRELKRVELQIARCQAMKSG
jgi:hypothetical protein